MRKILLAGVLAVLLCACRVQTDSDKKVQDLDFTVMQEKELPPELLEKMEERKAEPFKFTYRDEGRLYLCAGYGQQDSGGYSIVVEELYLTENSICFDTTLIGPEEGEEPAAVPSYPRIAVQITDRDLPVVFR